MKILITGGTGYIGSHLAVSLIEAGHEVELLDDLSNSFEDVLGGIRDACGTKPVLHRRNVQDVAQVLRGGGFGAVAHLAALKSVAESMADPLVYYEQNLVGTMSVCRACVECAVPYLLFSSSACVYGDSPHPSEETPPSPCNPYGRSKLYSEGIISDVCRSRGLRAVSLRYFNPSGAHPCGALGERPKKPAANLMPLLCAAARGDATLKVFGKHLPTADGSPVRDYVHVMDIAEGHVAALEWLQGKPPGEFLTLNLGRGEGASVLQLACEMAMVCEREIRVERCGPRPGDAPCCFANVDKARALLGWEAKRTLRDICADAWSVK